MTVLLVPWVQLCDETIFNFDPPVCTQECTVGNSANRYALSTHQRLGFALLKKDAAFLYFYYLIYRGNLITRSGFLLNRIKA
jgi:hypothetical protein